MKVLLTGANGFVGSHIVEELLLNNYEVVCVVRKNSDLKWISNQNLIIKYGELDDKVFMKEAVASSDVVIHCAGAVRAFDWSVYKKVNVDITKNIVDCVLESNQTLKKFIFISSQAAMGPAPEGRVRLVSDSESPVSDYGKSKLLAENEVRKLYGKIPYTILRPAAVYGPRDKDIFTFFSLVNKHLAPKTLQKHIIQLVFVRDIAKIIVKSINTGISDNKIYYLSDGKEYSWKDVADTIAASNGIKTVTLPLFDFIFKIAGNICEITGAITKKPQVLNQQKITEMLQKAWVCDNSQTVKDLDFTFENLENGSKITYNWYLRNKWF